MKKEDIQKLEGCASRYIKFETSEPLTWCGSCGNYGIQNALKRALSLEGLGRKDVLLCFDVGCNGNGADKIRAYTIHGLHGRVISLASGAALANPNLKVIASAGDGATFSEGVNHLVHAIRSNYRMVFIHHNNENYGLTDGQASALTRTGCKMNGTPDGVVVEPLNSLDFVLSLKPTFVARSFSGEVEHMTEMLQAALHHPGFAFVEILQACPTYNRDTPDDWYAQRVKDIKSLKSYDRTDIWQARKIVQDLDQDIYVGLLYEDKARLDYLSLQKNREGCSTSLVEEVKLYDVKKFF